MFFAGSVLVLEVPSRECRSKRQSTFHSSKRFEDLENMWARTEILFIIGGMAVSLAIVESQRGRASNLFPDSNPNHTIWKR